MIKNNLMAKPDEALAKSGAGDGIRTHDLLLGKETFYSWTTPASPIVIMGH